MEYKVVITSDAEADLEGFIRYLLFEKKSNQAALNFLSHDYFLLYRIEGDTAIVDNIFHELQDYENKIL